MYPSEIAKTCNKDNNLLVSDRLMQQLEIT